MSRRMTDDSESRFLAYVEGLSTVIGHADRAGPSRDYCLGLMMPVERKSVEPMAAVTAPARTAAQHQSLLHFVGQSAWSDAEVLAKAGVPEEVGFKTKHEIALEQLRWACEAGLPRGVGLLDAGYGNNSELRAGITGFGLTFVAGILSNPTVWAPGTGPLPAKKWSGRGRPTKLLRRDAKHQPVSVKELALGLPKRAWHTIAWREGTAERLSSRFARVRVRAARRDFKRSESRAEEWLLIEWPKGEQEPTKYWLSTLPEDITLHRLVYFTKLRWRIERDYQELKQEVGLGHFEGRGWRGFHHHATLCIAAYGFLVSERET